MRYTGMVTAIAAASILSGCVYVPSASLIDHTPLVKIGSTAKPPKEFILFIPANTKFPMKFSATGDAFDNPESSTVMVSFKQDMYLYDYWASTDGKKWMDFHTLLDVKPTGGFDSMGANISIKMDYAK
ncbi:hypothetical protein KKA17_07795 [bacterium]|nr:hypothetical protein [bacterium]MBU1883293.1 hypothetical protein [bacterium]